MPLVSMGADRLIRHALEGRCGRHEIRDSQPALHVINNESDGSKGG
jgi:hypothetical protein